MEFDDFRPVGLKPITELRSKQLILLLEVWAKLKGSAEFPSREMFTPKDLQWMLPDLVLIDIEDNPRRYFCRLMGSNIAQSIKQDHTGKYLDEISDHSLAAMTRPTYDQVVATRAPVASERFEILDDTVIKYESLVLPLSKEGGKLDMLMVGLDYKSEDTRNFSVLKVEPASDGNACRDAKLQKLLEMWNAAKLGQDLPLTSFIDPFALKFLLGNLIVFDVRDEEPRFVYRLMGTKVAAITGRDLTGQGIGAHPLREMADAYLKGLTACVKDRRPLIAHLLRPSEDRMVSSEMVVLPLMDEQAKVRKILVGQVYEIELSYHSQSQRSQT